MVKRGQIFSSVAYSKPKRSMFNLSYENKLTLNMGQLVPFYVQEVSPHDTLKVGNDYLLRAQPMLAPMMHRVDVYQHYFFVPYRIIWNEFEKFITGGESGEETAQMPYLLPIDIINATDGQKKLLDLLGYPMPPDNVDTSNLNETKISTLRLRAYNRIYNEYYRDQNLQYKVNNNDYSSHDVPSNQNYELLYRAWKKDYFTSALPFAQRGVSVGIPWTGGDVELDFDSSSGKYQRLVDANGNPISTGMTYLGAYNDNNVNGGLGVSDPYHMLTGVAGTSTSTQTLSTSSIPDSSGFGTQVNVDPNGTMRISQLDINIDDFRRANAIQRWLEKNARAGGRYVEQILSHFGIHPKDYRLDRPQYLGGGLQPLGISEIVQSSATEGSTYTPQGNLAGKATSTNSQYVFKETFDEHGVVIGLISIIPHAGYQQGLSRHLTKFDKFDFMQPEFANLGEQAVENQELYFSFEKEQTNTNTDTFGYQSRYAEYKYTPDEVHGDFRSSMNFWHLNRIFANRPLLNGSFVECRPSKRVFAVTTQNVDSFLLDIYNSVDAKRCLPTYSTPAL